MAAYQNDKNPRRLLAGLLTAVVTGPVSSGIAWAQLEEIVVTAQKRVESLQNVPIAITPLTAETLQLAAVDMSLDLEVITPGLQTAQLAGGWVPRIRGIGSTDTSPGNEPSVATYFDGVYMAGSFSGLLSLNNVERIEVLKGPQGTLFGRNATGGLIHVITKDPQQEAGGNLELTYGRYDTKIVSGYGTTGISDNLAADLAVRWEDRGDGWGTNLTTGKDTFTSETLSARSKWLWTPGERTNVKFIADHTEYRLDSTVFRFNNDDTPYDYDHDINEFIDQTGWGASFHIDHDFDPFKLVSITAYRDQTGGKLLSDADYGPQFVRVGRFSTDIEYFTQELQIVSPDTSKLQWIAGVYYMYREVAYDPAALFGGLLENIGFDRWENLTSQDTTSYSAFAQATYPVFENTNLTLGLRYTEDKQEYEGVTISYRTYPGPPDPNPIAGPAENDKTMDEMTYRVALDHRFSDDIMAYASFNTGFKSGTFPVLSVPAEAAEPELITAYEVGVKADLLDNRLRLNAAAYYYDFEDFQSIEIIGTTAVLINAGDATVKGLELEGTAAPTDNWNIRFGVNYMPTAKYDNFENCPGPVPGAGYDCSGSRIISSPEWDFTLGTDYTISTSSGDFILALTYHYQDEFPWDADHGLFPVYEEDSRTIVNLRGEWRPAEGDIYFAAYVRNATDEKYEISGTNANGAGERGMPGGPLTYGLTLGYNF